MKIVKVGILSAVALSALFGVAASASSWDPHPETPQLIKVYTCKADFAGGSQKTLDVDLTYKKVPCQKLADGNTLCRPVETLNKFDDPNLEPVGEVVTMTKPVSCGAQCSVWEYTVNKPYNVQCKSFRVERIALPGGTHARYVLSFRDCSNSVVQTCSFVE